MEENKNMENHTKEKQNFEGISTDSRSYRTIGEIKNSKEKSHFGSTILLPFFSGVVGTAVVLGTCFGVPSIRKELLGNTTSNPLITNTIGTSQSSNTSSSTNLISLANYSETGIAVADKVRPSIVGIKVEYSVNSIFYRNSTRFYG